MAEHDSRGAGETARRSAGETARRIDIGITLEDSGIANVKVRHTAAVTVAGEEITATEARLTQELDRQQAVLRATGSLFLQVARWKKDLESELDQLLEQNVLLRLDIESGESQLTVSFIAEYLGADLAPLVHSVVFPRADRIGAAREVVEKLQEEWEVLRRVFAIARTAGTGVVTQTVPPPFLESGVKRTGEGGRPVDGRLLARVAAPEEAKRLVERYLDNFRFPLEVEEKGVRYGFIPRVEVWDGGRSIKMTVTVLVPPQSGKVTFMKGGSKSVAVPVDEIYVQGEELNRKTKEGVLELLKGLCRTLGREKGLTTDIDITRPR